MDKVQAQVISEIITLLDIKPEEVIEFNKNFQDLVADNSDTTADMITACKMYDPASFLAGAMISTTVLDLVRTTFELKLMEQNRLEGNNRDVI